MGHAFITRSPFHQLLAPPLRPPTAAPSVPEVSVTGDNMSPRERRAERDRERERERQGERERRQGENGSSLNTADEWDEERKRGNERGMKRRRLVQKGREEKNRRGGGAVTSESGSWLQPLTPAPHLHVQKSPVWTSCASPPLLAAAYASPGLFPGDPWEEQGGGHEVQCNPNIISAVYLAVKRSKQEERVITATRKCDGGGGGELAEGMEVAIEDEKDRGQRIEWAGC
ncbi:unnamed protein product [Pleuronectes platessa]|uniref:Uncharacterized protein n=1 Tax=Pleuronectes platessa TaxID=8262 RepID=A0A9N7URB0_PLEPL|nr:unnamed protein product [Pleuronectes platessa]